MFERAYPVANLRPAPYNPRTIDAAGIERLARSIATHGFAKPVIVTKTGLLVAGHQRTKAAQRLCLVSVPAYVLPVDLAELDEVRFNQLHNGSDADTIDVPVRVPAGPVGVFEDVPSTAVAGGEGAAGAVLRTEIGRLMLRYGPWGGVVATADGEVLASPHYALVCRLLRMPCRVYRIDTAQAGSARAALTAQYGEFSYTHLPRNPYMQTYAQPRRLRGKLKATSALYERRVLPTLGADERLLDFGYGQGDYLARLRGEGRRAFGIEFFARKSVYIDARRVHADIDATLAEWRARGGFDVVVCEAVLNSVDSPEAGDAVLGCVAALAREGGRLYFSTRRREALDKELVRTRDVQDNNACRWIEFLDRDGFSATFRHGAWFFQRFQTEDDVRELAARAFGDHDARVLPSDDYWHLVATLRRRPSDADIERALRYEFDLPWPQGKRVGRADAALAAWREVRAREAP